MPKVEPLDADLYDNSTPLIPAEGTVGAFGSLLIISIYVAETAKNAIGKEDTDTSVDFVPLFPFPRHTRDRLERSLSAKASSPIIGLIFNNDDLVVVFLSLDVSTTGFVEGSFHFSDPPSVSARDL